MLTEQQEKWLKRAEDIFKRFGIKSVTMDDVARELGISKKTLYQFVENKNDLVIKVVEQHIREEKVQSSCLQAEATDAVDEILLVLKAIQSDLQHMRSNIIFDLQKYHRDAWDRVQEYQQVHMLRVVRANLDRGIREGLYRTDFNADLVARFHVVMSLILFDENWFPRPPFSLDSVLREHLLHYLHGIVSEKGLHLLKAKLR